MALTDMRLRVFSSLLVASVLAGCGGTSGNVVDTPADVLPEPQAAPSVSTYRWIEVAEVLRRHLPMVEGQRGMYLLTARDEPFIAIHGPAIDAACTEDWCRASMGRAQASGERVYRLDPNLGLLPIPKEQLTALREKLLATATPDDPDVHALKLLADPPDNGGFWRVEDEKGKVNTDPGFSLPYAIPAFVKVDSNVDWDRPLPEGVAFHGSWLTAAIARGEIEPPPRMIGGTPSQALIRPLADGGKLLTVVFTAQGCGGLGGYIHYVLPPGSRSGIKVFQQLQPGMDCPHPRGRTPEGLVSTPAEPGDAEARFYATAAHLEAASVIAFERLAQELAALDAPDELVTAALDAAEDEKRHAEVMLRLGARHGVLPTPVDVRPITDRSTLAIALENAVEGCVNEAFAAVLCDYQAASALDPALAAEMRVIAEEEHRHAALAQRTAIWLATRLGEAEQAEVRSAVAAALQSLPRRAQLDAVRAGSRAARLGIPSPARAALLAERFVELASLDWQSTLLQ